MSGAEPVAPLAADPTRRLRVASSGGGYDVVVAPGALASLADTLRATCDAARYALITDDTVAGLHGDAAAAALAAAGTRVDAFAFPAGEAHKTRETWAALGDAMLDAGLGRDAGVVAFGGGVVGDVAGFVAATFMRGVPVVQVPTTLLAMIDASVGGKTGVDTAAGKNLIGAFHPPRAVIVDPLVLATLPAVQLRSGLAEAVKHGAIADAAYLERIDTLADALLTADPAALVELIARSIAIKSAFVAEDEHERGPRKLLNFGHTVGHAVEALSGYAMPHGEAVAIGMVAEARLGERLGATRAGTAAELTRRLRRLGLPVAVPAGLAPAAVVGATRSDKKARDGRVEYALIRELGTGGGAGRWTLAVDDADAEAAVRESIEC